VLLFDALQHTKTHLIDFRIGHNMLFNVDEKRMNITTVGRRSSLTLPSHDNSSTSASSPTRGRGSVQMVSSKSNRDGEMMSPSLQSLGELMLSTASHLLHLELSNCGLVQLKRSGFLHEFDQSALTLLLTSLENNHVLVSLNLSQNNIQASSCELLSSYLSGVSAEEHLGISKKRSESMTLGSAGAARLNPDEVTDRRKVVNKLVKLDLSHNNLGGFVKARWQGQISTYDTSGMEKMVECLASHRHLQILQLKDNNIAIPKQVFPVMQVLRRFLLNPFCLVPSAFCICIWSYFKFPVSCRYTKAIKCCNTSMYALMA
jgi:hypothetical protein